MRAGVVVVTVVVTAGVTGFTVVAAGAGAGEEAEMDMRDQTSVEKMERKRYKGLGVTRK